ncbi:NADH-quinone oxidoreductase subunit H [Wolbachia endosymbiont of Corcyra cephalonica]|uniref:NADH-quinone oxidoreductase subunit H n=1 Tax=Wolbachia endosymbiont of Corcyra cephalonica TaxID=218111 RepID=UPI0034E2778F
MKGLRSFKVLKCTYNNNYILLFIIVLLRIAFVTLLERKILGYIQLRKGPNKVLYIGLIQPVIDGIKLFMKEFGVILTSSKLMFNFFPFLLFYLMICMWYIFKFINVEY